jgi:hypothetical protein
MVSEAWSWLGSRGLGQSVLLGLALAAAIEGVTCLLRFGLGMQATRDTEWIARFTLGFRIHHGYFGILALAAAAALPAGPWRNLLVSLGTGLVVSDLVHHFAILWMFKGSPEFHVKYPE